jgi:hypothetical protein
MKRPRLPLLALTAAAVFALIAAPPVATSALAGVARPARNSRMLACPTFPAPPWGSGATPG